MDLCIKTPKEKNENNRGMSFNPCFNGSMYKNSFFQNQSLTSPFCFNPCFNGSMYKNIFINAGDFFHP